MTRNCEDAITYLTMSLGEAFVIDTIAFVDQLHSAVEARKLVLELMLGALSAYLAVIDQTAVANPAVVVTVLAEIEFVTSIAAVKTVIVTAGLELELSYLQVPAVMDLWAVAASVQSADQSACLSCQAGIQAIAAVADAVNQRHYFESPIAADAYSRGYSAGPLTAAAAAADFERYSAGSAISAAAAAACLQHCFVVQLTDFAAYWRHLIAGSLAVAAAASLMFAVDEYQKPVVAVAAA